MKRKLENNSAEKEPQKRKLDSSSHDLNEEQNLVFFDTLLVENIFIEFCKFSKKEDFQERLDLISDFSEVCKEFLKISKQVLFPLKLNHITQHLPYKIRILEVSCRRAYHDVIKPVLKFGASGINAALLETVYPRGNTTEERIKTVKYLLEDNNLDINTTDDGNNTPLILAAYRGNAEIVRLLLSVENIDVNLKDIKGNDALSTSVYKGREDIVTLLLSQKDININTKVESGWTSLMIAVDKGRRYQNITKLLLDQKDIDLGLTNDDNKTALMIGCSSFQRNEDTVKLLLSHENNYLNKKTNFTRNSALSIAFASGGSSIVNILLSQKNILLDDNDLERYEKIAREKKWESTVEILENLKKKRINSEDKQQND